MGRSAGIPARSNVQTAQRICICSRRGQFQLAADKNVRALPYSSEALLLETSLFEVFLSVYLRVNPWLYEFPFPMILSSKALVSGAEGGDALGLEFAFEVGADFG